MVFLLLAITCSVIISCIVRYSKTTVKDPIVMYGANYVVCVSLGLIFFLTGGGIADTMQGGKLALPLIMGLCTGVLYPVGFLLMSRNVAANGVALTSVFSKLGILVPTVLSIVVFNEEPTLACYIGLSLAILAIVMMGLAARREEKAAAKVAGGSAFIWLIIHMLQNGVTESANKVFDELCLPESKNLFLLMIFSAALIFAVIRMIIRKSEITKIAILLGIGIGFPNYFITRLLLRALEDIPGVIVFPVYSAGTIVAVTLVGTLVFKEKLSKAQIVGILMIIAALVLLNI